MNSIKRYLIVSVLAIAGVASALACGPWSRPHYYVFSAYQRNQLGYTFTDRMEKFWYEYAPELRGNNWHLGMLSSEDPQDFENSSNVIIKAAINKKDKEMQDYLRLLVSYLSISDGVKGDTWGYPTKEDLAQREKSLKYLNYRARSYGGTRMAGQYCLLVMRTNMLLGDHASNLAYWSSHKDKLSASVYKDMMKDIYAGALVNSGKIDEAASIYYELGDMNSLMWLKRDERNLEGIKKEYARNPNSPSLIFLVQDFVNNTSDSHYSYMKYGMEEYGDGDAEVVKSMKDFVGFAQKVVNEDKTKCPALWQSAMGWLNHSLGNSKEAIEQLNKAMKMGGTDRMRENARVCRMVATAESEPFGKKQSSFLKQEFQWMDAMAKSEPNDAGCFYCEDATNHYTEVMQNLIYDSMAPTLLKNGQTNVAAALVGWQAQRDGEENEYKTVLDNLNAQEMIDYYAYLNGKPASDLEAMLLSTNKLQADLYNDMVGTKMIREGRFAEAIPYLEKVSLAFINGQAIAPYASVRDYHKEQCFVRQTQTAVDFDFPEITRNQKLDFCKEMVNLNDRLGKETDSVEKAQVAYVMANMYLQASYRGNCWYLSRYGNSVMDTVCYKNEKDFLAEAAHLYDVALSQPGLPAKFTQCYLYAAAFLPFGEPYQSYIYDEDYNGHWVYNKQSHQYKSLLALKQYTQGNPPFLAPYITKCDILKRFLN